MVKYSVESLTMLLLFHYIKRYMQYYWYKLHELFMSSMNVHITLYTTPVQTIDMTSCIILELPAIQNQYTDYNYTIYSSHACWFNTNLKAVKPWKTGYPLYKEVLNNLNFFIAMVSVSCMMHAAMLFYVCIRDATELKVMMNHSIN